MFHLCFLCKITILTEDKTLFFCRTRPRGHQTLAQWAIPRLHDIDALTRMVDPSLHGAYPMKSLSRFADIISRSLQVMITKLNEKAMSGDSFCHQIN